MSTTTNIVALETLASGFGSNIDWSKSSAFIASINNDIKVVVEYHNKEDLVSIYSELGNIKEASETASKNIANYIMEANPFGVSKLGGSLGVSKSGVIVYTNVIRNISSITREQLNEEGINVLISSITKEKKVIDGMIN